MRLSSDTEMSSNNENVKSKRHFEAQPVLYNSQKESNKAKYVIDE